MKKIFLSIIFLTGLACAQTPIPATSFGMHDNNQSGVGSSYPTVPFGTFRFWDNQASDWYNLETARGVYNWAPLDTWVNRLNAAGVDIIYTFGYTPLWATGGAGSQGSYSCLPPTLNQDMIDFISAVATRYNGKIKHYETWNEPTGTGPFWCGTLTQLVQVHNDVYTTVKAIDPTAVIHTPVIQMTATVNDCSGGGTYGLNSFVNALGDNSKFDVVDAHLYPYPGGTFPESSPGTIFTQIANLKCGMAAHGISSKPIWNTEFSWGQNSDPGMSVSATQVAMVGRYYLYLWSQDIARSYWYAYDNPNWGTLFSGGVLTPAGVAYQQVYNWMVGSTMTNPCSASGTVWTCSLVNGSGVQTLAIWNTAGNSTYTPDPQYTTKRDLAGATTAVSGTITIGLQPLLLVGTSVIPPPPPPSGTSGTFYPSIDQYPSGDLVTGCASSPPKWCGTHDAGTPGTAIPSTALSTTPVSRNFTCAFTSNGGCRFSANLNPGAPNTVSTIFTYDVLVNVLSPSSINQLELDSNQGIALDQLVIFGIQCNLAAGLWDYTVQSGGSSSWVHTTVPCTRAMFTSGQHHIILGAHRSQSLAGNVTYDYISFDGNKTNLNITVNSLYNVSWAAGAMKVNFQFNGNGSGSATINAAQLNESIGTARPVAPSGLTGVAN